MRQWLGRAAGAPRRAAGAQSGVELHRHRRNSGCAGPVGAVLTDRFAVSMTADVNAQRVAVAQELATASRKRDRRLSGWDRRTRTTRFHRQSSWITNVIHDTERGQT